MNKTIFGLMAVTLAAAAAVPAFAFEPVLPHNLKTFNRLDANQDGKITLSELRPKAEQRLLRLDTDKNSEVSAAEIDDYLRKALEKRRAALMTGLDADKNGAITVAELDKFADAMLNGADADKDGGVTLQEARNFKFQQWRKKFLETGAN